MKKTKFKLILNSNSYRIYTDNGIEYCRFKKKYYPLTEIENVINSYKIGGAGAAEFSIDSIPIIANSILDAFFIDKIGSHWKQVTPDTFKSILFVPTFIEKKEIENITSNCDYQLNINGFNEIDDPTFIELLRSKTPSYNIIEIDDGELIDYLNLDIHINSYVKIGDKYYTPVIKKEDISESITETNENLDISIHTIHTDKYPSINNALLESSRFFGKTNDFINIFTIQISTNLDNFAKALYNAFLYLLKDKIKNKIEDKIKDNIKNTTFIDKIFQYYNSNSLKELYEKKIIIEDYSKEPNNEQNIITTLNEIKKKLYDSDNNVISETLELNNIFSELIDFFTLDNFNKSATYPGLTWAKFFRTLHISYRNYLFKKNIFTPNIWLKVSNNCKALSPMKIENLDLMNLYNLKTSSDDFTPINNEFNKAIKKIFITSPFNTIVVKNKNQDEIYTTNNKIFNLKENQKISKCITNNIMNIFRFIKDNYYVFFMILEKDKFDKILEVLIIQSIILKLIKKHIGNNKIETTTLAEFINKNYADNNTIDKLKNLVYCLKNNRYELELLLTNFTNYKLAELLQKKILEQAEFNDTECENIIEKIKKISPRLAVNRKYRNTSTVNIELREQYQNIITFDDKLVTLRRRLFPETITLDNIPIEDFDKIDKIIECLNKIKEFDALYNKIESNAKLKKDIEEFRNCATFFERNKVKVNRIQNEITIIKRNIEEEQNKVIEKLQLKSNSISGHINRFFDHMIRNTKTPDTQIKEFPKNCNYDDPTPLLSSYPIDDSITSIISILSDNKSLLDEQKNLENEQEKWEKSLGSLNTKKGLIDFQNIDNLIQLYEDITGAECNEYKTNFTEENEEKYKEIKEIKEELSKTYNCETTNTDTPQNLYTKEDFENVKIFIGNHSHLIGVISQYIAALHYFYNNKDKNNNKDKSRLIEKINDSKEPNLCKKYNEYIKEQKSFKTAINILNYQPIAKSLEKLEEALNEICNKYEIKIPKQSVTSTQLSAILTQDPEEIKRLEEAARKAAEEEAARLAAEEAARKAAEEEAARLAAEEAASNYTRLTEKFILKEDETEAAAAKQTVQTTTLSTILTQDPKAEEEDTSNGTRLIEKLTLEKEEEEEEEEEEEQEEEEEVAKQTVQTTTLSAILTQNEIKTPQILSPDINDILKKINESKIDNIYLRYIFEKSTTDKNYLNEKTIKSLKEYNNICDAVNRLMIYLTDTANNIKADNYTNETQCDEYNKYFKTLVFTNKILDEIIKDNEKQSLTKKYIKALNELNRELPTLFKKVEEPKYKNAIENNTLASLIPIQGGDNNYKTAIDNIFNYTESSDESDILYDSDISEESIISIRSDYSEDLITPLLASQT